MIWTKEHMEWLEETIKSKNYSYNEITRLFNQKFRESASRNSILGRAHRSGLLKRMLPRSSGLSRLPRGPDVARVPRAPAQAVRKPFEPGTSSATPVPEPTSLRPVGWAIDHHRESGPKRTCLWPDSPSCTEAATLGAYCDTHAALAYRAPPARKRTQRLFFRGDHPLPGMLEEAPEGECHGAAIRVVSGTASAVRFETPDVEAT